MITLVALVIKDCSMARFYKFVLIALLVQVFRYLRICNMLTLITYFSPCIVVFRYLRYNRHFPFFGVNTKGSHFARIGGPVISY